MPIPFDLLKLLGDFGGVSKRQFCIERIAWVLGVYVVEADRNVGHHCG